MHKCFYNYIDDYLSMFMLQVCTMKEWFIGGGGEGHLFFFSGRGVRPGFPKFGPRELIIISEKGGLVN